MLTNRMLRYMQQVEQLRDLLQVIQIRQTTRLAPLVLKSLIQAVPELKDVAVVTGQQIANIASSDVDQATLLKLANEINKN